MMLFFFLSIFGAQKSLYVRDTEKMVVADHVDSVVILGDVPKPQNLKHIKEAGFTEVIPDDDYPRPGKEKAITNLVINEGMAMMKKYNFKDNVTQDELYYHPVGPEIDQTTFEVMDSIPRRKAKIVLNPMYGRSRTTGLYVPPGELVTIQIKPGSTQYTLSAAINAYKDNCTVLDNCKERLPYMTIEVPLKKEVSTIGFPPGGLLTFIYYDQEPNSIEINVSGCIETPRFIYGVTTEEEWETYQSKLKVPIIQFDSGNTQIYGPISQKHRNYRRMNDLGLWWRSAFQHAQDTAKDTYNEQYVRIWQPNMFYVDTYVSHGQANAAPGDNFNQCPSDWIDGLMSYENCLNGGWGTIHEMNHHRQGGWGISGYGESSNNAVNAVIYSKITEVSGKRTESKPGVFKYKDWERVSHSGYLMNVNELLNHWVIFMHHFGIPKFQKFVHMLSNNIMYPKTIYSTWGASVLLMTELSGYDMYEYVTFYTKGDSELGDKRTNFFNKLNSLPSKGKYFHPVNCMYTCGFVKDDGEVIETAMPYFIEPKVQQFDFVSSMRFKTGNATRWGDFEFFNLEGRNGAWKSLGKGVYEYTPIFDDWKKIDEFIVSYKDKVTGEITKCFGKFKQLPYISTKPHLKRYANFTSKRYGTAMEAYKVALSDLTVTEEDDYDSFTSPNYENGSWLTITSGIIYPEETGDYIFGQKCDDMAATYLSENPLAGNPDDDEKFLINYHSGYIGNANNANKSKVIHLEKKKPYYINFVIYNPSGKGNGELYVKHSTNNKFEDFPKSWLKRHIDSITEQDIADAKWVPSFIDNHDVNLWRQNFNKKRFKNLKVMYVPNGGTVYHTMLNNGQSKPKIPLDQVFDDCDQTREYRSLYYAGMTPFPQNYTIDFGETFVAEYVNLRGSVSSYFRMNSTIEIRFAEKVKSEYEYPIGYNYTGTLNVSESIVYKGRFVSWQDSIIKFSKKVYGRYLQISVYDNNCKWELGERFNGYSAFSQIEIGDPFNGNTVIPLPFNRMDSDMWKTIKDGYYINGRAKEGKAGATFEFTLQKNVKVFGIIGDIFPWMGKAIVSIDGVEDGIIDSSLIDKKDTIAMNYASRSHMKLLYVSKAKLNEGTTVKIYVESGSIIITGIAYSKTDGKLQPNDSNMFFKFKDDVPPDTGGDEPDGGDNASKMPPEDASAENDASKEEGGGDQDPDGNKNNNDGEKGDGNKTGLIAGVIVGVVVVVAAVVGGVIFFIRKKKINNDKEDNNELDEPETQIDLQI